MAQRVQIVLEDDFDGGTADETVTFGLDGVEYQMDLSTKNAKRLRETLSPFVEKARKTGGRRKRGTKASAGSDLGAVRAWAAENGHKVSSRGRIPAAVLDAYENSRG